MPKPTGRKIGHFVWLVERMECGRSRWKAGWRDPLTRRYVRRLLPVATLKEAEREALAIDGELVKGRGFQGRLRGSTGHGVADAILLSIRHTQASERTQKDYASRANPFLAYLATNAPGVQAWGDVSEPILANYLEACRRERRPGGKQGFAYYTIHHRLAVLHLTSSFMARTYPLLYRDAAAHLKFKRHDPPRGGALDGEAVLDPAQLRGLLDWLRSHAPMIHVWATLQVLAGLRMLEAVYLREQDFDPASLTVRVAESSAHKPKTLYSHRTIPICNAVALSLSNWINNLKVRHPEGFLFTPSRAARGRMGAKSPQARAGALTQDFASHLWRRALKDARADGVDLSPNFIARRLRASFVTAMRAARADFADLQTYIGHAPSTILSAHYDAVSMDRLSVISGLAQELGEGVGRFGQRVENRAENRGVEKAKA